MGNCRRWEFLTKQGNHRIREKREMKLPLQNKDFDIKISKASNSTSRPYKMVNLIRLDASMLDSLLLNLKYSSS